MKKNETLPKKEFDISEFFIIKRKISECSRFYEALYNLAHINFDESVTTAAVSFDRYGNMLNMKINPIFWDSLNNEAKTFVILHELSHVVYDHGKRFIHLELDFELANIASDIVINHNLNNNYDIVREDFNWEKYCWVETCFKDAKVTPPNNRSFEYYYNLLNEAKNIPNVELLGSHSDGTESPEEKQENAANPNNSSEEPKKNKFGNIEVPQLKKPGKKEEIEKQEISDVMKEIMDLNPELIAEFNQEPNIENLGFDPIKEHVVKTPKMGKEREGDSSDFVMQELPNFEKLMKILIPPQKKKYREDENETWVGTHRRYMSYLDNNPNVSLPNVYFSQKLLPQKKKNVWIFIDNSGSCSGMFHTFSSIAVALMKSKDVECRGFTFGDTCDEIKLSENMRISFYAGNDGGFDCIENKILKILKEEKNTQYPENIVVLSDGGAEFNCIKKLKQPKSWVMLINNNNHQYLTPQGGKYIVCDTNFFNSPNKSNPKMR